MLLKELSKDAIKELRANNKWLDEKISEQAGEEAMWQQGEEFKLIGADAFDYHDHYSSFYLSCPTISGAKSPEKLVGKLNADYMSEEDARLYKELCELNDKMEDAEEWDETRPEYDRMREIADELAEHITEQLKAYEDTTEYEEQIIDDIVDGYNWLGVSECNWLGELEVEDGKIKEVIYHD